MVPPSLDLSEEAGDEPVQWLFYPNLPTAQEFRHHRLKPLARRLLSELWQHPFHCRLDQPGVKS